MAVIAIYVNAPDDRFAKWVGDPGWISMPAVGDSWAHCEEWAGEIFSRIWWNGPSETEPAHTVEIKVNFEVFQHLVSEHGFAE